ncbi:hypothetical protein ACO0LM_01895 [Undibacterium sp. Di26W]|uniref:hypothetical protein n=1 Tax=Undibacterium sp. Di26W TaxID=3413035 RepID=UPI003BF267D5
MKTTSQPAPLANLRLTARAGLLLNWLAGLISVNAVNVVKTASLIPAVSEAFTVPATQGAGRALTCCADTCEPGYQDFSYYWTRMIDIRGSNP